MITTPRADNEDGGVSVVLVDDHPMWRNTLRRVIEEGGLGTVVAEASDGEEGLRTTMELRPDVVIMDINLPGIDGNAATRELTAALPGIRVLVLSASDERHHVLAAMRAGAKGYLLKTAEPSEVAEAIRRVQRGELVLPPQLADVVLTELRTPTAPSGELAVVLADSSALFRQGVARMLADAGLLVSGEVATVEDLLAAVGRAAPAVVILDVELAGPAGAADIVRRVRDAAPGVGVLFLAATVDEAAASAVVGQGAGGTGYLLKDRVQDAAELVDAIRRVATGGSAVDPEVAHRLVARERERDPFRELTPRERDVLRLMAEGRSNRAICDELFLSAKSVENHVRNIFMKLGLEPAPDDNRRVLAVLAYLRTS